MRKILAYLAATVFMVVAGLALKSGMKEYGHFFFIGWMIAGLALAALIDRSERRTAREAASDRLSEQ